MIGALAVVPRRDPFSARRRCLRSHNAYFNQRKQRFRSTYGAIVQPLAGTARTIPIVANTTQTSIHNAPKCLSCIARIFGLPFSAINRSTGYTTKSIAQPSNMPSMPNTAMIPSGPSFVCKHEAHANPMTNDSGAMIGNHARLWSPIIRALLRSSKECCLRSVLPGVRTVHRLKEQLDIGVATTKPMTGANIATLNRSQGVGMVRRRIVSPPKRTIIRSTGMDKKVKASPSGAPINITSRKPAPAPCGVF